MKVTILVLLVCLNFSHAAFAQSENFEFHSLIGRFPELGSTEEKADIDQLLFYQQTRTQEQCDAAELQSKASLENFFGGRNGPLSPSEIKKAKKKLTILTLEVGIKVFYYKAKYKRPRPYVTHPEVKPCIDLEKSKSYPSGHTTLARAYGKVLSVMFPERSVQIMASADQAALNRVIGGVHHPSDVAAGKKLGDDIAEKYLDTDGKRYELERFND